MRVGDRVKHKTRGTRGTIISIGERFYNDVALVAGEQGMVVKVEGRDEWWHKDLVGYDTRL